MGAPRGARIFSWSEAMKFSIVDDDPILLRLMQSVPEEGGHHVVRADLVIE